jgi:hypothetical protein
MKAINEHLMTFYQAIHLLLLIANLTEMSFLVVVARSSRYTMNINLQKEWKWTKEEEINYG